MFAIQVVLGWDQALNARRLEALKFVVELETNVNPNFRARVLGSRETYRKWLSKQPPLAVRRLCWRLQVDEVLRYVGHADDG